MKTSLLDKPREFIPTEGLLLKDMGKIELETDEQITFVTASNRQNDIVKKEWGFYLCNSINWNLRHQGFRTALVVSRAGGQPRIYINLVENDKMESFCIYLEEFGIEVLCWLDDWFFKE